MNSSWMYRWYDTVGPLVQSLACFDGSSGGGAVATVCWTGPAATTVGAGSAAAAAAKAVDAAVPVRRPAPSSAAALLASGGGGRGGEQPEFRDSRQADGGEGACATLEFRRNAHGKPHLIVRAPLGPVLHHNLTHTHDLAGVALLRQPQHRETEASSAASTTPGAVHVSYGVGLDVERLDRVPRYTMALARRRLAASEVRDLEALSGEERARRFMWLWTLKEAYVKARGTGISAPPGLRGFAIGFEDMPPASSASPGDGVGDYCHFEGPQTHFSFLLFQPTPHHVGALCLAVHPASAAAAAVRTAAVSLALQTHADGPVVRAAASGLVVPHQHQHQQEEEEEEEDDAAEV
ncbi:hypothetical protein VOLCADRAFT_97712 [Volvox carteri f. nagariensis]|uniref:holo-[acyl-carrier-protein] synthase n=1 Tax=Volvox carteri f. nagariensis TaxID=3068 RepID=D8UDG2_VOLCA|nr:uncharacterized protein VOLCADRAFT_97712 [Volvox carteri f. nagariensis]EFJ42258.1 hypothetical protein VOLCADRAFT_97712 [Volvox carteri f. nagariensis]|eukprot:XP_002956656.1 hypothetical protein VOLCADRAFT_97712 [Volvox carteri f. nagariensis]